MNLCRFWMLALCVTCGSAPAQQRFDFNRLVDAGKNIASLAKGITEQEEIDIGRGLAGRIAKLGEMLTPRLD